MLNNSGFRYSDVEFGKASGETEGAELPELVEHGYLDHCNNYRRILDNKASLVLGYKGSGKSLLGEKLRLARANSTRPVSIQPLGDFPFKSFAKIHTGAAEPEAQFPTTWSWILLLYIVDHMREEYLECEQIKPEHKYLIEKLMEIGILPIENIKLLVTKSSKQSVKIQLFKMLEYNKETENSLASSELKLSNIVESLRSLVGKTPAKAGLTIVIDGLDDILSSREVQYQSLAALIFEIFRLNLFFTKSSKPFNIVALCRTELYERLPGPNKNKLRQDSAVEIDWFHDPCNPGVSQLVALANLRATLSCKQDVDVHKKWFPQTVDGTETWQFLLDLTRHTPRDFLQLLNHLKNYCTGDRFTAAQMKSGARDYSVKYFLPEIRDEIVGYSNKEMLDKFFMLVGEIRQREFSPSTLFVKASEEGIDQLILKELLTALFDCSAIGNKWGTRSGYDRYEFRYRNRNATIDISKTIVLHKGLWKALNLT